MSWVGEVLSICLNGYKCVNINILTRFALTSNGFHHQVDLEVLARLGKIC
jgi:hypothetical protein